MPVRVGIMLPSRETAMTGEHDAQRLVAFAQTAGAAGFDAVGRRLAGRGAPLDKAVTLWRETWHGQGEFADALPPARVGGPPVWLAGYVDAGARHLILRIGSLSARPESVAEQLLPELKEIP